jgi:tripartite ATP-independent transporter DctP family solute receptor
MKAIHAIALWILAMGLFASSGLAQDYTIRFASALPPEMNHSRSMKLFKEEVEKQSKGRIKVELFFSGTLGGTAELLDQVKTGSIQMSIATTGFVSNFVPRLGVYNLPFLFKDTEAAQAVLDETFDPEFEDAVAKAGFKALGFEIVGWRNPLNKSRPIETVESMAGMKIRLQPVKVHLDTYTAIGANPVGMDFKELYTALQQGVIDAMEVNYQNMHDLRFYEVATYVTDLPMFIDFLGRWMNRDFWDKLPPDMQQVVLDASKNAVAFQREVAAREDAEALEKMLDIGVVFNKVRGERLAEFRKVTAPVYEKYAKEFGKDLVERLREKGQR